MVSWSQPGNFKKEGITPVLDNHRKENFALSRAFLGKIQGMIGELSNEISSFRVRNHQGFLINGQVTFMLHYRIYSFHTREIFNFECGESNKN